MSNIHIVAISISILGTLGGLLAGGTVIIANELCSNRWVRIIIAIAAYSAVRIAATMIMPDCSRTIYNTSVVVSILVVVVTGLIRCIFISNTKT